MTTIDFDQIAANADRSIRFRQMYRDVRRLRFFLQRWKETGDRQWANKARNNYSRLRAQYQDDTVTWRMKCIASGLANVDTIAW